MSPPDVPPAPARADAPGSGAAPPARGRRRRGVQRAVRGAQWAAVFAAAWLWRRLLWRTRFVGVTGSVGKTTTRALLAAALATRGPTVQSARNENDAYGVPRSLLRVRPWHRFAVLEVAAGPKGVLGRSAGLLRPHVAVVLSVAATHTDRFADLEETAAEKAQLLRGLRRGGTAVLNADDPRVAAMASPARGRVLRFGTAPGADVRAEDVGARWPERLHLRVVDAGGAHAVTTSLVGVHWAPAVLAAWTVARHLGVAADAARAALAEVEPMPARLQPVALASGATVLRDEGNGSLETFLRALAVLRDARARRRWLVASDVSDAGRVRTARRLRGLGEAAARLADGAVFVGPHGHHAVRAALRAGADPDRVRHFEDLRDAAAFLAAALGPGDLALLKGRATDHVSRLLLAQQGPVACWKATCPKRILCDDCPELRPRRSRRTGPASG